MKVCIADIEANGLFSLSLDKKKKPKSIATKIHCIAVKPLGEEAVLFPPDKLKEGLDYINTFDVVVGHNFHGFDAPVIRKFLGSIKPKIFDTLLMSQMMYPDKYDRPLDGHSLESWGKYLGNKKTEYKGGWEHYSEEMGKYCLQDISTNESIYVFQQKYRDHQRIPDKSVQLENIIATIAAEEIAVNGFWFDVDRIPEVQRILEAEAAEIMFKLKQTFPDEVTPRFHKTTGKPIKPKVVEFNSKSHVKIDYYFRKYLDYEFDKNPDTGNAVTDADAMLLCPYPEADLVLQHRERATLLSYMKDWRTRAEINPFIVHSLNGLGTQTGRASHSDPNLGQVSKASSARTLFRPHPGEVMVGSDLSGLELRLLAHYLANFGNTDYIDVILNGDIHWHNALLAGLATDQLYNPENPVHSEQRNQAKTFIYGWLYGAGAAKIGKIIRGTARDGSGLRDRFLNEVPGLKALKDDIQHQVRTTKGVKLVDGRIVPVRSQHAALNTLLQGSGAMVCKLWLALVYKRKLVELPQTKILAWVHDEIQSSIVQEQADRLGQIKSECAVDTGKRFNLNIQIDAEYQIGANWKETH